MELIKVILSEENLDEALRRVKANKGASGIDKMPVSKLDEYFKVHKEEIKTSIMEMKYKPSPVRRVYIPKSNGKKRPLGIPTAVDRVMQQAVAQVLSQIYDSSFSENSYGFRPNRSAHDAIDKVLEYLNEGYEWVIDLDIEKYFDTVNHDKLISILREKVNDKTTLHLIRAFLRAGVMENGLVSPTEVGVPQGGPLSPILSNIYLDKFDKELEERGLKFSRYADDSDIFVKSELAANRVMKSVTSWLERKLFLKVSATKTKVVRPNDSNFLGFTFWKGSKGWKCRPSDDRKTKLYTKIREVLQRKAAVAKPLSYTSDCSWVDKLLPHRKYENVHERVWGMATTQDTCSHNQTVEKANENLYESAENQQEIQMQFYRRRYIQGGKHKTGIIPSMRNERNQFYHQSKSTGNTKSGKTRFSQSAGILSKIVVN